MLSLHEIQEATFEKAIFGGYDMKSVDVFLEQLTEDYAALMKENAALKAKMKVLVEKIEDYKSVESGIHQAFLSAQKIANEMVEKAREQSENTLKEASLAAEEQMARLREMTRADEDRLAASRLRVQDFVYKMKDFYEKEISALDFLLNHVDLSSNDADADADTSVSDSLPPATEKPDPIQEEMQKTKDMEHVMRRLTPDQAEEKETGDEAKPAVRATLYGSDDADLGSEATMNAKMFEITLGNKTETVSMAASEKPRFEFENLKFGKDYSPMDDAE